MKKLQQIHPFKKILILGAAFIILVAIGVVILVVAAQDATHTLILEYNEFELVRDIPQEDIVFLPYTYEPPQGVTLPDRNYPLDDKEEGLNVDEDTSLPDGEVDDNADTPLPELEEEDSGEITSPKEPVDEPFDFEPDPSSNDNEGSPAPTVENPEGTYLLHDKLIPVVESLRFPLDSAIMKRQALEAMEGKILVHFYDHDETGCDTCQVLVLFDPESDEANRKLVVLSLNSEASDHGFELQVEKAENGQSGSLYDASIIQWEAQLEEALTTEALETLLEDPYVEVELLETFVHTPETPDKDKGKDGNEAGGSNDGEEPSVPGDGDDNGEEPDDPNDGDDNGEEPDNPDDRDDGSEEPDDPNDRDDNGEEPREPGDGDDVSGEDSGEPQGDNSDDSEAEAIETARLSTSGGFRLQRLSANATPEGDDNADSGTLDHTQLEDESSDPGSADFAEPEDVYEEPSEELGPPTEEPGGEPEPPTEGPGDESEPPTEGPGNGSEPPPAEPGDDPEPPIGEPGGESKPPVDDPEEDDDNEPLVTHRAIVLTGSADEMDLPREEVAKTVEFAAPGKGLVAMDIGIQPMADGDLDAYNFAQLQEHLTNNTYPTTSLTTPLTIIVHGNMSLTGGGRYIKVTLSRDILLKTPSEGSKRTFYPGDNMATMLVEAISEATQTYTLTFKDVEIDGRGLGGGIFAYSYNLLPTNGIIIEGAVIKNCDYTWGYHDKVAYPGGAGYPKDLRDTYELTDTTYRMDKDYGGGGMLFTVNAKPDSTGNRNKLINCTFENNESFSRGGGLCIYGYGNQGVDIENCTFNNNRSKGNVLGGNLVNGYGGAFNMVSQDKPTAEEPERGTRAKTVIRSTGEMKTTFTGNTAAQFGGAIYLAEGSECSFEGEVTIDGTVTIEDEEKTNASSGGGLCSFYNSIITIEQGSKLTIENNETGSSGGGLTIYNSTLNIYGDLILQNNETKGSGGGCALLGAKVVVRGTFLIDNNVAANGGGMWNIRRNVVDNQGKTIEVLSETSIEGEGDDAKVTITNNKAMGTGTNTDNANGNGGGLLVNSAVNDYTYLIFKGTFNIVINKNTAGYGGGIYEDYTQIDVFENVELMVGGSGADDGNTANNQGGGICLRGAYIKIAGDKDMFSGAPLGGNYATVYVEGNTSQNAGGGIAVYHNDRKNIISAVAHDRDGGKLVIRGNKTGMTAENNRGGGMHINGDATLEINNDLSILFEGNEALYGGGLSVGNGATFIANTFASEVTLTFINNEVKAHSSANNSGMGGAIHLRSGAELVMDADIRSDTRNSDTLIIGGSEENKNIAANDGGGIYMEDSGATFNMPGNADISFNEAGRNGGGIYVGNQGQLVWYNYYRAASAYSIKINNNMAGGSGGGLYYSTGAGSSLSGAVTVEETNPNFIVSGNTASVSGGGLYLAGGNTITVTRLSNSGYGTRMQIADNHSPKGGGIYTAGAATFSNSYRGSVQILNHTDSDDGAGIYVANGASLRFDNQVTADDVQGVQITGNKARGDGGGAYIESTGRLFLERDGGTSGSFLVSGNEAEYGGGFYLEFRELEENIVERLVIGGNTGTRTQIVNNTARRDGGAIFLSTDATARDYTAYQTRDHATHFFALKIRGSEGARFVTFGQNKAGHYDTWSTDNKSNDYLDGLALMVTYDMVGRGEAHSTASEGQQQGGHPHNNADINNYSNIPLVLRKVTAEDGEGLAGAGFTAYFLTCTDNHQHDLPGESSSCWEERHKVSSLVDGQVDMRILEAVIWRILETTVPEGYEAPNFQYQVTVIYSNNRNTYSVRKVAPNDPVDPGSGTAVTADAEGLYSWENALKKAAFPLSLRKVDGQAVNGNYPALQGARFQLYACSEDHTTHTGRPGEAGSCWQVVGDEAVSNIEGLVYYEAVVPGSYALIETAAPNGYNRSLGYWTFTFNADSTLTDIEGSWGTSAFIDLGGEVTVRYLVTNTLKTPLPLTGGTYLFFASGLMGTLLLYLVVRRLRFVWRQNH